MAIYIWLYIYICIYIYRQIDFLNDHCLRISISGCLAVCELEHGPFIDGLYIVYDDYQCDS